MLPVAALPRRAVDRLSAPRFPAAGTNTGPGLPFSARYIGWRLTLRSPAVAQSDETPPIALLALASFTRSSRSTADGRQPDVAVPSARGPIALRASVPEDDPTGGQGPTGLRPVAGRAPAGRARRAPSRADLPSEPDGTTGLVARAWAVRGVKHEEGPSGPSSK